MSAPTPLFLRIAAALASLLVAPSWEVWASPPPGTAAVQTPAVPAQSPSDRPDQGFLELKSFDLEPEAPIQGVVQVGDTLRLRILNLPSTPGLQLGPAPGEDPILDQGWYLELDGEKKGPQGEPILIVSPIQSGRSTLPSLLISGPGGERLGRTNPYTVEVQKAVQSGKSQQPLLPPDQQEQNGDPADQPVPPRPPESVLLPWWVMALGVLLVLAGVAALVRWIQLMRRNRPLPPPEPEAPPLPEDQAALESLQDLERQGLMRKNLYKQHYFAVSEITKRYLGSRYRFDASESTAREIIERLESARTASDTVVDRLEQLFDKLDRVKFTDHVPDTGEGAEILEEVRKLVAATRRPPVLPPIAPGLPPVQGQEGNT